MLPAGSIVMWGSASPPPAGWLICDGAVYDQDAYRKLFESIGHNFGDPQRSAGFDPTTQFFVPDLRGRFVRGVDDTSKGTPRDPDRDARQDMQSGVIVGPQVGSIQDDQFEQHTHGYNFLGAYGGIASGDYWAFRVDQTGSAGGSETRPLNAYVFFIICTG